MSSWSLGHRGKSMLASASPRHPQTNWTLFVVEVTESEPKQGSSRGSESLQAVGTAPSNVPNT